MGKKKKKKNIIVKPKESKGLDDKLTRLVNIGTLIGFLFNLIKALMELVTWLLSIL